MWARESEILLGIWLVFCPALFTHAGTPADLWITDLICGLAVVVAALLSHWRRTRYAHLASLAVAAWLAASGWLATRTQPLPAHENHIVVGLLLGMFAIVPSFATEPPRSWAAWYRAGPLTAPAHSPSRSASAPRAPRA